MAEIFAKQNRFSEMDKYIFILAWNGPHRIRVAFRCLDGSLSGPDTPWETSRGNWGPMRASQGITGPVRSQLGHLKPLCFSADHFRSVWICACLFRNIVLFCKNLGPLKEHKIGSLFEIYLWISVFRWNKRFRILFIFFGDIKQTNILTFF